MDLYHAPTLGRFNICIYSVMQSDGNSLFGDVVLTAFTRHQRQREFLVLECCITLDMHFLQSLLKIINIFNIFIIKIRKHSLFVHLV